MKILAVFVLFIYLVECQYIFMTTKAFYNGSISYNGLFKACQLEFPDSKPCTVTALEHYFWNQHIPPSWYLRLDYNCVGYTTDKPISMGACVVSNFGIVTGCSCDMNIPICCYVGKN